VSTHAHLAPELIPVLDKPIAERVALVKAHHWFGYPGADRILSRLERLMTTSQPSRVTGAFIGGESNNGKSHIARRLKQLHPPVEDEVSGIMRVPVLHVDMPASPDESRFYDEIFTELWQPFRAKDPVSQKSAELRTLLRNIGTNLLLVDEIQNVLGARDDRRRALLDALRFLSNKLGIAIVCIGTLDAMAAFAAIDSIINRFPPILLPAWALDSNFRRLLASFERVLPFPEASSLSKAKTAALIHSMSEGRIGEVRDLLVLVSEDALENSETAISYDRIESTAWVRPSERKRKVDEQKLKTRR
jgi:hypothetical protein